MRRALTLALLTLFAFVQVAPACFGPKLYLGVDGSPADEALYALVELYVKEKTGTETVRVALAGGDPVGEVAAERVDMVFLPGARQTALATLLAWPGLPRLVSGPRPLEELQFATIAPAIAKLQAQLSGAAAAELVRRVRAGAPPAAAARALLTERGLI